MYVCRRFGVCASSFGRSPNREIGFVSFVRASGRGEAACLRERDNDSLAGPPDSRILLLLLLRSIEHCALHVFFQFAKIFVNICMGLMHPRRFC